MENVIGLVMAAGTDDRMKSKNQNWHRNYMERLLLKELLTV